MLIEVNLKGITNIFVFFWILDIFTFKFLEYNQNINSVNIKMTDENFVFTWKEYLLQGM